MPTGVTVRIFTHASLEMQLVWPLYTRPNGRGQYQYRSQQYLVRPLYRRLNEHLPSCKAPWPPFYMSIERGFIQLIISQAGMAIACPSTSILSASAAEKPPNIISGVVMSLDDVRIYYLQNGSHADAMRCNVLAWSAVSMTGALANGWWIMW